MEPRVVIVLLLYILPSLIAVVRYKRHGSEDVCKIIVINLLLGLLWGVGWVIALIWACKTERLIKVVDTVGAKLIPVVFVLFVFAMGVVVLCMLAAGCMQVFEYYSPTPAQLCQRSRQNYKAAEDLRGKELLAVEDCENTVCVKSHEAAAEDAEVAMQKWERAGIANCEAGK